MHSYGLKGIYMICWCNCDAIIKKKTCMICI